MRGMSEDESGALYQSGIYALVMLLLVFGTVVLWAHVSVFLLLGLPMVYYLFIEEWDEYKRQKRIRKMNLPRDRREVTEDL
jgi:hypothetical protein